ncbi:hypothetical protein CUJ83_00785 [Methanocella sp. CWC-04]|uniref:PQQ-like domain-containing protein n=1 Tax=Methanooceanicella nereidis TaxID=2052831 RepID=A0AAP2W5W8_9EURY|nr:hypothetical protein [Methanocella sp. CWC-04]MCD1293531.1 hypothetical protein [Methanocella sp. CWC-04]
MEVRNLTVSLTIIILASLFLIPQPSFSESPINPYIEWETIYPLPGTQYCEDVEQTADGGFILLAYTSPIQYTSDILLVRLDKNGNVLWKQVFDHANTDFGYSVAQTGDGGFIISGTAQHSDSPGTTYPDIYIIKTDASGNKQWETTFGGDRDDYGLCICQNGDSGYIVSGLSRSYTGPVYLAKLGTNGNLLWNYTYSTNGSGYGNYVTQTGDGGFIVIGSSLHGRLSVLKTDANGIRQWDRVYGYSSEDQGLRIVELSDGGFLIPCTIDNEACLIKTDPEGNEIWNVTSDHPDWQQGRLAVKNSDGYMLTGFTWKYAYPDPNVRNIYFMQTDGNGELLWKKMLPLNGTYSESHHWLKSDQGVFIEQTSDGGYIVAGTNFDRATFESDLVITKIIKPDFEKLENHTAPEVYRYNMSMPLADRPVSYYPDNGADEIIDGFSMLLCMSYMVCLLVPGLILWVVVIVVFVYLWRVNKK